MLMRLQDSRFILSMGECSFFGPLKFPLIGSRTAATFDNLRTTLTTLALEYRKPLQVVETDYPALCNGEYNPIPESSEPEIPYSIAGQIEWVTLILILICYVFL